MRLGVPTCLSTSRRVPSSGITATLGPLLQQQQRQGATHEGSCLSLLSLQSCPGYRFNRHCRRPQTRSLMVSACAQPASSRRGSRAAAACTLGSPQHRYEHRQPHPHSLRQPHVCTSI